MGPHPTPFHMSDMWWGEGMRRTVIDFRAYGCRINIGCHVSQYRRDSKVSRADQ